MPGFKPEGSRNINPEHAKVDREAKPEVSKKTQEQYAREGGGWKPAGSRHVPEDQM